VALVSTAGLPVLAAVDAARPAGQLGDDLLGLAHGLADGRQDAVSQFVHRHDNPEARAVASALQTSWVQGLDPDAAHREAAQLLESLWQERRLRGSRAPLTAAVLPGFALLNLFLLFLLPLGASLLSGWAHL
jgi:hypothetical protein